MKNLILFSFLTIFCTSCVNMCAVANDASDVMTNEAKLSSQVKICEWFLKAEGALKAKEANLQNLRTSLEFYSKDRSLFNLKYQEYSGIQNSYNILVGEYNSNLARYSKTRYIDCNGISYKEYLLK
jgi:hypothetical protein